MDEEELNFKKCVKCGKKVRSISPMRKYCFDCRIKMRKVWFDNFKKRRAKATVEE